VAVLVFGLVLAGGGAVYQEFAERRDRSRYPAPGRMVDVGGYRMHVRCLGEGSPAVILESGMGMSSNAWALVQPTVARFTRACSYDRAGYGWSEAGGAADPVSTLHLFLKKAGISGPYVFAGHSLGSILARIFAHRYPSDTAGMVLVASSYVEGNSGPAEPILWIEW
jgi:pimeloyl-ACP methyl ester carboxylesterase